MSVFLVEEPALLLLEGFRRTGGLLSSITLEVFGYYFPVLETEQPLA